MSKYYVHCNGAAWFVKEAGYFESQGGLTEPWGTAWTPIYAEGVEHARSLAMIEAIGGEHALRRLALEAAK